MALKPNSYNLAQDLNLERALNKIKDDKTRMNLIRNAFLDALPKYHCDLNQVPEIFRNEDFYKEAVKRRPNVICEIPPDMIEKLCQDPSFCLSLVKKDGWLLRKIPEEFRSKEVCLEAFENNMEAFYSIPEEFRSMEVCLEA